ncbi:MAG: hypothetical protein JWN56_49 [Sphingobacteriales bacterium]|nr:hypothetical protein [Sphingobacteriales bacterium]
MNHGIEKAISGLSECAKHYKKQHLIKISKETIIVKVNDNQLWGTLLYLLLIMLTPLLILVYYLYVDNTNSDIFWALIWLLWFGYELYRILRGDNILIINLEGRYFEVENINAIFKTLVRKRRVLFSDIAKANMEEKFIYSRYRRIKWYELTIYDKEKSRIVLSSFDEKFPLPSIGNRVKLIVDLILKEQKQFIKSSSS